MTALTSWILAAAGLLSCWLLGRKKRVGWAVAIALNIAWLPYATSTEQWGFIPAEVAFLALNVRGWQKWRPANAPTMRDRARAARAWLRKPALGYESRIDTRGDQLLAALSPALFAGLMLGAWAVTR